jgi:hypothetical protein
LSPSRLDPDEASHENISGKNEVESGPSECISRVCARVVYNKGRPYRWKHAGPQAALFQDVIRIGAVTSNLVSSNKVSILDACPVVYGVPDNLNCMLSLLLGGRWWWFQILDLLRLFFIVNRYRAFQIDASTC